MILLGQHFNMSAGLQLFMCIVHKLPFPRILRWRPNRALRLYRGFFRVALSIVQFGLHLDQLWRDHTQSAQLSLHRFTTVSAREFPWTSTQRYPEEH